MLWFRTEWPRDLGYLSVHFFLRRMSNSTVSITTRDDLLYRGSATQLPLGLLGFVRPYRQSLSPLAGAELSRALKSYLTTWWRLRPPAMLSSNIQVAIPVFVSCNSADRELNFCAAWVHEALREPEATPLPFEVVACRSRPTPDERFRAPRPVELPLTLACDPQLLDSLIKRADYLAQGSLRRHTFRLESWHNDGRTSPQADILVLGGARDATRRSLSRAQWTSLSARTRLVIVLGASKPSQLSIPRYFRTGVAVAAFTADGPAATVKVLGRFLREILHDLPVHEALHLARQDEILRYDRRTIDARPYESSPWRWQGACLYATPEANESLRLSSAVPRVSIDSAARSRWNGISWHRASRKLKKTPPTSSATPRTAVDGGLSSATQIRPVFPEPAATVVPTRG